MLILKKYSKLPKRVKMVARFMLSLFWRLRHVFDKACSRKYKQIVICGYPRSGTSLLYNMFSASLRGFYFDEFESLAIGRMHRYGNYVTKSPVDIFNIGKLKGLNIYEKEVYVVVVIRDIRDVLTSMHPNVQNQYFIGYDHSWWPQNNSVSKWVYDAPGIIEIYSAITSSENHVGLKVIKVKYEEIVTNIDALQDNLEGELSLKFSRPLRSFYKNKSKLAYKYDGERKVEKEVLVLEDKPIDTSRLGKWRNKEHEQRIREQFTQCPELFDILIDDGYEKNRSWFDAYIL